MDTDFGFNISKPTPGYLAPFYLFNVFIAFYKYFQIVLFPLKVAPTNILPCLVFLESNN